MDELSVRQVASDCLGRRPRSLLRDVFGVYGSNPRQRSLRAQLTRIRTNPFVRVACVTVQPLGSTAGQDANQQRDLDNANDTLIQRCGIWVYCSGSRVIRTNILGANGIFDQRDCNAGWFLDFIGIGDHEVSGEERALFNLGRDLGADVTCYFLPQGATSGSAGCAAHPDGRRGFWVGPTRSQWTFAHELGHVVGNLGHRNSRSNLMFGGGTVNINVTPPQLTSGQCDDIADDRDVEECQ